LQGFHLGEPVMLPPWRADEAELSAAEEIEKAQRALIR